MTQEDPVAPVRAEDAVPRQPYVPKPHAREKEYTPAGSPGAPLLSVAPMMDWTDIHYR